MKIATIAAALLVTSYVCLASAASAVDQQPPPRPGGPEGRRAPPPAYSLEQAVSDEAQLHTIAFDGLAFITGSFGASTFIPPGKVADFFGFQYMRDIDAAKKGHNPQFLDRVAGNVLRILDDAQRALFEKEANAEAVQLRALALRRFPLIAAFHKQLDGRLPAGSAGLDQAAVARYTGAMFADDASLAYQRAAVYGRIVASLTEVQKSELGRMRFGDFNSWPAVDMERYKLPRGSEHLINVAYMTLASEFFSWYAGSVQADTYFCPERHGTYFGGFFLKDAPAMGQRDFDISTALTGDLGEAFVKALSPDQRRLMTELPDRQRKALEGAVETRRAISTELRRFLKGETADRDKVVALGRRYGAFDGEMSYLYAMAFSGVSRSLTPEQRNALVRLRDSRFKPAAAYLYSDPLREVPPIAETDTLFFPPK